MRVMLFTCQDVIIAPSINHLMMNADDDHLFIYAIFYSFLIRHGCCASIKKLLEKGEVEMVQKKIYFILFNRKFICDERGILSY